MSDTAYQMFQDGQTYKVRIARLGEFIPEADGFASHDDATVWVAQAARLGVVRAGQQAPKSSPHLRVV